MNIIVICLASIFLTILIISNVILKTKRTKKIIEVKLVNDAIKGFDSYIAVLQYHMNRAYDVIYKDRILAYSLDGLRIKEYEIDVVVKDYCTLVLKMLGPALTEHFSVLYGNIDTFLFNVVDYFNTRYEDDEIRNSAITNMTNEDKDNI